MKGEVFMKRKMLKTAVLSGAAAMLFAMTAFADTRITSVSVKSSAPDYEMTAGECVSPEFYSGSGMYEVSYTDETSSSSQNNPKTEHTYEIRLDAYDGYYFPDEDYVNVKVDGATRIIRKRREDSTTFTIRVRAYPYYQWPEVTGIEGVSETSTRISWDKGGASKWEYVLEWTDTYGEEKQKHSTTTKNYVDVKSYNKEYTGSNEDRDDSKVTAFSIRAVGNAGDNERIADGVWTGNADYSEYEDDYSTWYEAVGSRGNHSSSSSGSGSSGSSGTIYPGGPGSSTGANLPSYVVRGTWTDHGNGLWSFTDINGKQYRNEWAAVDNSQYANTALGQQPFDWFWFDANGFMYTGWLQEPGTGNWFYLQTESNGTRGAMFTGWHWIGGKQYYFNEVSDGTRGRCTNPYQ